MPIKYPASGSARPIVHHHIVLKPHHRWIIGSFTSVVLIFMVTLSVFSYMIFTRQEISSRALEKKISDLKTETNTNVNALSESIILMKENVDEIGLQVGVINEEFAYLKASAGEDFSGIIEASVPSVVTIKTDFGQGTGFIINSEGYIVTNAHVLSDGEGNLASGIHTITYEQGTKTAEFIGYDGVLDIALLKISGTYTALKFGNSNDVQVGEKVIAIGNPLGLQFSVSQGIVSAVHRQGPNSLKAYIQTDAALNPGNSGGPLIDGNGRVIGINNFKVGEDSESLGFALESNYIESAINKIYNEKFGKDLI